MQKYLVGGAVRDHLLKRRIHDKDYVVVGSTIEEMLQQGYKQVGAEFPVFLHPETGDEYALARTERKTGDKHTDFVCSFSSDVTLKEDLSRRDFTMNALALTENGTIFDYFNGVKDIENKVIRHISPAFSEDPLRVLRAIRFACQLDFTIADETKELCKKMVKDGMLDHLTKERIWKEMEKALHSDFDKFILYLDEFGYLEKLMPDVYNLKNVPENMEYHPEGNTFAHVILTLQQVKIEGKALINFALLCHDLGKNLTENWPKHHNHDDLGIPLVDKLCDDLMVPNEYRNFAKLFTKNHMRFYEFEKHNVKTQYDFIKDVTKFKDFTYMDYLLKAHKCDLMGRDGVISQDRVDRYHRVYKLIRRIYDLMENVTMKDLPEDTQENLKRFKGEKFGKLYRDAMISLLKHKLKQS